MIMKKRIFITSLIPLLLLGCSNLENILPKDDGKWNLARVVEEFALDEGLIYQGDTTNLGTMTFAEDGLLTLVYADSSEEKLRWSYDKSDDEVTVMGWEFSVEAGGATFSRTEFVFRVQESTADTQLWQAEERFTTLNPFTQLDSEARIAVQWRLQKIN